MNQEVIMYDVQTTYDSLQRCTALKLSRDRNVVMDCPYTGRGEEFSPTNLVEAALGGCMLIAMGTLAMRHGIDLSGARVEVHIASTNWPTMRFTGIDIAVTMPQNVSARHRLRLERAAERCPIKHSFAPDIPVNVTYEYPEVVGVPFH